MIPENFAAVGAVVASLGGLYYLYETIVGKSKPNRVTWLLWGVFPLITYVAQKAQGVAGVSLVTLVSGITPVLILIASFFNKNAFWKSKPSDYALMFIALAGMGLWAITKQPNIAITFALLADLAAAIPTVLKCYSHPETESWTAYGLSSVGFMIALLSIHTWTYENYAFVIYLFAINALMCVLSFRALLRHSVVH